MMTEEQRIEWLLELQEHPEQMTDEKLQQILADNEMRQLVQQLGFAKRAFKHDELKNDTSDVDAEWEKFATSHANELDAIDEGEREPRFALRLVPHKILGRAKRQSRAAVILCLLASNLAIIPAGKALERTPGHEGQILLAIQASGVCLHLFHDGADAVHH